MPWVFNPFTGYLDWTAGGGGGDHALLVNLDYASALHTGFQPTLTGAATLALILTVDGTGSLLDADLVDGQHANAFEPADATIVKTGNANWIDLTDGGGTILHTHAYEPIDATIVRTGQVNWIDLTDGGGTTLHTHAYEPIDATIVRTGQVNWIDLTDGGATNLHTHATDHAAVTLDVNADTVLSLSTQALGLDTQVANRVFSGPTSGAAAVPTFRALVAGDIPALSYEPIDATILRSGNASWIDLTDGGATTLHSHAGGSGDVIDSGIVVGQLTKGVTDSKHIIAAAIIPPVTNILTLTNAAASTLALAITGTKTLTLTSTGDYNLTVPATGTAALLGTANVFTVQQQINGALACAPTTNAFHTTSVFTSFVMGLQSGADGNNGGLYAVARYVKTNAPFTAFCGEDTGTARSLYFGGGGWNVPDATQILFYTAPTYSEGTNTGVKRMTIDLAGAITCHKSGTGFSHNDATRRIDTYTDASGGWIGTVSNHTFLLFTMNEAASLTITATGTVSVIGKKDVVQAIIKGKSTQTNHMFEIQDSTAAVHSFLSVPGAAAALENVFNETGSQYLDFRVESDTYDALFVDASANSIEIMHNAAGLVGFYGIAPVAQSSGATQVAPAAYVTGAFGLDSDAKMQALYDLVVAMRTALVGVGIMKGAA
jgi:hypothetical protein